LYIELGKLFKTNYLKLKQIFLFVFAIAFWLCNTYLHAQQRDSISYQKTFDLLLQKQPEKCLKQALLLKEQYTQQHNDNMFYKTVRLIGHCHKHTGNYKYAIKCYLQARKAFVKRKDTVFLIASANNLARVYYYQKKIDSAIFFSKEALQYNLQLIDTTNAITAYSNLVGFYVRQEKYNLAIQNADQALKLLAHKDENKKAKISLYNNLAGIYYKQKNYQKAKETYLKGYALFDKNIKLSAKYNIIYNLASVYILLGENENAKDFVSQALTLNDSLQRQKYNAKITEIEAKYNADKEQQKTAIEQQKNKELQLWLLAVTLFLLGVASIVWFFYRDNKIKKERLALRLVNQELEQYQKIKQLQNQNQNKVLNAVAVGKETERIAIAQVLHDSVGALLSSANMHLQVVKKKSNQEILEIQKTQNIIEEAATKVRNLSHQLISEVLLKFGLVVAIESLCAKYSNDALVFELVVENEMPRFKQAFEIKIHSIIEELLNNCIKHSEATEVLVSLEYEENMLTVTVEDNGIGLNLEKVNEFESVGLAQIKARVESANGIFIITSVQNKFSKFHIKIPVES